MQLMNGHFPNGRPTLLDARGMPIPTDPETGRPTGEAYPSGIALPHGVTFIARYQGANHTYWHGQYDEALKHCREDARVMRRDAYLMSLIDERKRSVSSLNWHLEVPDERDPRQMRVKDGLTRLIKGVPHLRHIIWWMLEALWYGRAAAQVDWGWTTVRDRAAGKPEAPGGNPLAALLGGGGAPAGPADDAPEVGPPRRALTITNAFPVNGDKIGFQYDHTPYVMVHSADASMMYPDEEIITTTLGRALSLRGTWRQNFLIHRHLMEDEDYYSPEMSGAIHGVGIRSKLFWLNWLKLEWLGNITSFFDRYGLGVMMWKYPAGNPQAKEQARAAAVEQQGRAHILVPVWGEAGREALSGVERMEVPTSGSEALVKLIDYLDGQIERYVVGQEGSSKSNSQGLGNEAASDFMQGTKAAITLQDAHFLAFSLTGTQDWPGMVNTMQRHTYPEADFPVTWHFDVERPESEKKLQSIKNLVDMGVKVRADDARGAAGVSKPVDGDEIVEPPQEGMPPGGMPGMPGAPGAGGAPQGPDGAPAPEGASPDGAPPEEEPAGDFLDAIRMHRRGERLAYDWVNKGMVKVSKTGKPMFRWYDAKRKQSRIQNVRPGEGAGAGPQESSGRPAAKPARLLGPARRRGDKIAQALRLMFPSSPTAWVRPSGLPALAGCAPGESVSAELKRDADGALVVLIKPRSGAAHELRLRPSGAVTLSFAEAPKRRKAVAAAAAAAGIDALEVAGERVVLSKSLDELDAFAGAPVDTPRSILKGNADRRRWRRKHAAALMARADKLAPKPEEELPFPRPSQYAADGHRFGCVLAELPDPVRTQLLDLSRQIRDEDLGEDGREDSPHVTVKYGLHTDDAGEVARVVSGFGPVTLRLGKVSVFPASESGGDDVVKVEVEGGDIRRLNRAVCDALEHTDAHPTYQPHATLAYVKPGRGRAIAEALNAAAPRGELRLDAVVFSDRDKNRTEIPLEQPVRHSRLEQAIGRLHAAGMREQAAALIVAYARENSR